MPTLLVKNAHTLVTMDDDRREIAGGGLFARDNVIEAVGPSAALPAEADVVIDAGGMVVLPGLVNTHHHFSQSLTRAVPQAQDAGLFRWLTTLYPIWEQITPRAIYVSARLALCELLLSGCTTASDHLYLYPNGARIDDEIEAARELGIRFHPSRGSMSLGASQGGLPPDSLVEADEDAVLADTRRAIEAYHQSQRYGLCRIAVAPCAPFNVSEGLMRGSIALARAYGVLAHTHVAETHDEEAYCLERVGRRPVDYMRHLGWVGPEVWYAHAIWLNEAEVALMAETGTGVAHCPGSNMRLGSGIAPIGAYLRAGVRVGLGVDGSSSNDSGHLLAEARLAMLLQRVAGGPGALSARRALELATRGGARVLGRDDVGQLAPGMAADLIGVRLDQVGLAGAEADPVAALVFCHVPRVDLAVIDGRVRVHNGEIVGVDLGRVVAEHRAESRRLLEAAG